MCRFIIAEMFIVLRAWINFAASSVIKCIFWPIGCSDQLLEDGSSSMDAVDSLLLSLGFVVGALAVIGFTFYYFFPTRFSLGFPLTFLSVYALLGWYARKGLEGEGHSLSREVEEALDQE